ncbi:MAG: lipoprotein insertase outer membrane protein LolB [Gallionellaceae bacterium]|jgi:outer membrane lipoprotein LolB
MKSAIIFLFALAVALSLSGCATPPANYVAPRTAQIDAPFELRGRVAIKHDGERFSAGLSWKHHTTEDEILLIAPLGQTIAKLLRNSSGVTLETNGTINRADSVETLTEQELGWQFPLSGLSYWVVALPAPASPSAIQHNADGQMTALAQDGWKIHYSRYVAVTANSLPLRLTLQREQLAITILIDEWKQP